MTERRGDEGFSVAPRRLGGPPGRRRFRGIGVFVAIVAIVAVASLGPRLSDRPSLDLSFFATPVPNGTPSPTPSPTPRVGAPTPGPTPLPIITRPEGPATAGRLAILSDNLRVLDLGTGRVVDGPPAFPGRDSVISRPEGS